MYQSIQVQNAHRIDRANYLGAIGEYSRYDGTVKVMLKKGDFSSLPFGGFIEASNVLGIKRVKIQDLVALCIDLDGQDIAYSVPKNHYTVGTYLNGKLYVLTFNGKVKHHFIKGRDDDYKNNVYTL